MFTSSTWLFPVWKGGMNHPVCVRPLGSPNGTMAKARARIIRILLWRLEALGYDWVTTIIRLLPVDTASAMGGALLRALGPLTRAHRTAALGLRVAFPTMPDA